MTWPIFTLGLSLGIVSLVPTTETIESLLEPCKEYIHEGFLLIAVTDNSDMRLYLIESYRPDPTNVQRTTELHFDPPLGEGIREIVITLVANGIETFESVTHARGASSILNSKGKLGADVS